MAIHSSGENPRAKRRKEDLARLVTFYNDNIDIIPEEDIIPQWSVLTGYTDNKVKEHIHDLRHAHKLKCRECKEFPSKCQCKNCDCHKS